MFHGMWYTLQGVWPMARTAGRMTRDMHFSAYDTHFSFRAYAMWLALQGVWRVACTSGRMAHGMHGMRLDGCKLRRQRCRIVFGFLGLGSLGSSSGHGV